jgi:hypothetical protein
MLCRTCYPGCNNISEVAGYATFVSTIESLAGCSEIGCTVKLVEETIVDCWPCGSVRRRMQAADDEILLLQSNITFQVFATPLNITQLNEYLSNNFDDVNNNLTDSNSTFTFTSPAVQVVSTPSTSPSNSPSSAPLDFPTHVSSKSFPHKNPPSLLNIQLNRL